VNNEHLFYKIQKTILFLFSKYPSLLYIRFRYLSPITGIFLNQIISHRKPKHIMQYIVDLFNRIFFIPIFPPPFFAFPYFCYFCVQFLYECVIAFVSGRIAQEYF